MDIMTTKKEEKKEESKSKTSKKAGSKTAVKSAVSSEVENKEDAKKADTKKSDAKSKTSSKVEKKTELVKEGVTEGKKGKYFYAVGRRKRAIAQVRLYPEGKGEVIVNDKKLEEHLPIDVLQESVMLPLKSVGMSETADVTVKTHGGGIRGQADAIRLGIARALLIINPDYRATLKPLGLLTRDSRKKERKKFGLKKARRAPQWSKR